MKRLLSLLSVLTISGTAVPTTIAASPYEKQLQVNKIVDNKNNRNKREIDYFNKGILNVVFKKNNPISLYWLGKNNNLIYFKNEKNNTYDDYYKYNVETGETEIINWRDWNNLKADVDYLSSDYKQRILDNKEYFIEDNKLKRRWKKTIWDEPTIEVVLENINCSNPNYPLVKKNKIYFGSNNGKLYSYEPLKLIKSDIINLEEQVRRGLYFIFSKTKNISNINLSNLDFVETKAIKIMSKPKQIILLPFYNYHEEKTNDSNKEIIYNSPDDEISEEITKAIEIQKGLSVTHGETKTETKTTGYTGSFGITVGAEVEAKIFGNGITLSTEVRTDHSFSNENSNSNEITLENSFNSSNIRKEEKKETMKKIIKSQQISIPSKKKLIYNSKIYKYNCEDVWNLTKKINGQITASVVDENNNYEVVNISIKKIMKSLKENNLLPQEITINDQDDSIIWTGKIVTKYTCGFEQDSNSETKLVDL